MKITQPFAEKLLKLKNGERLPMSDFRDNARKVIECLLTDRVLRGDGKSQRQISCANGMELERYLQNKEMIGANATLEQFIAFFNQAEAGRSDAFEATGDDKYNKNIKVLGGFLLNAYDELYGYLHENKMLLKPIGGSYIFIQDYLNFSLDTDITVVLVENAENLKRILEVKYLFAGLKPIFISRYQNSNIIAEWLSSIPNPYLHFGDFDLKGLHIYITEFRNKINDLPRCQFFIPENIQELIKKHGSSKLFDKQRDSMKNIDFTLYPEIKALAAIIQSEKKGLPQEYFIRHPKSTI
jgi:hypothetical protein